MKFLTAAGLIIIACLVVYWPHQDAQFILDDYYTVVRNPLIKNPLLYPSLWTSRLFDAHQSSEYIKFGYYRPVLQFSWIVDYRLFALKAFGYQWLNLLVHALNCFFIFILLYQLFGQAPLALKTCLLFGVLPTQEWVVRYVTGRGDSLSALFALISLMALVWVLKTAFRQGYVLVFVFWAASALTREVAISYILYAFLIYFYSFPNNNVIPAKAGIQIQNSINRFCLYWILIGILPFLMIWSIILKQGNILVWHVLYFASVGFCLWMAQLRVRWFVLLFVFFAALSFYQGRFWTTEEVLLRHTRSLECWPHTVVSQQLLMKYDDNVPAINGMAAETHDPFIKAMWLRRLGTVYFNHGHLSAAQKEFNLALSENPSDVDALDALAVVYHHQGQESESLRVLNRAFEINPFYPDTLKTLGIHFFLQKNYTQARKFLNRCLFFDPDNIQARQLLGLAKAAD